MQCWCLGVQIKLTLQQWCCIDRWVGVVFQWPLLFLSLHWNTLLSRRHSWAESSWTDSPVFQVLVFSMATFHHRHHPWQASSVIHLGYSVYEVECTSSDLKLSLVGSMSGACVVPNLLLKLELQFFGMPPATTTEARMDTQNTHCKDRTVPVNYTTLTAFRGSQHAQDKSQCPSAKLLTESQKHLPHYCWACVDNRSCLSQEQTLKGFELEPLAPDSRHSSNLYLWQQHYLSSPRQQQAILDNRVCLSLAHFKWPVLLELLLRSMASTANTGKRQGIKRCMQTFISDVLLKAQLT